MHELSIVNHLVETVTEIAKEAGAEKINSIQLRIGALSCVHRDALEFSFDLVTKGTILEGAELNIIDVPVTIFCIPCNAEMQQAGIQQFRCPQCGTPSADIRHGQELDIESIEITEMNKVVASEST
jgi:hydrogenase nickel incorporation protein HypA/HybF